MRNHKDQSNQNSKDNASYVDSVDIEGAYEAAQLIDNRAETTIQKKLNSLAENDPKAQKTAQLKSLANKSSENKKIIQKKENNTGLPDKLKSGVESLSGYSMDDVRVHKNSDKPAQLNAHAYAQGTEIHLAPGQEKHLPHETWHVAQQKQGRVKPTKQMKSKVNINDDQNLEREADIMGAKAMQLKSNLLETQNKSVSLQTPTVQRAWKETTSPEELYWDKEIDGLSWYCYADSDIMTFQVSNPDVMSSEDLAWYKSYEGQDYSYAEWINLFGSSEGISESSVPGKEMNEAATEAAPEFGSHFEDTSIGIENELTGFVCALPQNSSQKFAWVKGADGTPLVMITKDMKHGSYANPANRDNVKEQDQWKVHTVELVTYPSAMKDKSSIKERNDSMLWLAEHFTDRITNHNHKSLSPITSDDGRFQLIVSYQNHVLAAGYGASIMPASGAVGMSAGGQQATIGVKATDFGSGSSPELQMLEAAPWYNHAYKDDLDSFVDTEGVEDLGTMKNIYAYLLSVFVYTANLCQKWGIYIEDWDPQAHGIEVQVAGLTDPKVKNDWGILPRTAPKVMWDLLKGKDKADVSNAINTRGSQIVPDPLLWKCIYQYFQGAGEVAGHGINNATIGDEENPDQAALFEFRQMTKELQEYAPTTGQATVVTMTMDQFKGSKRKNVVKAVDEIINTSEEFNSWYQEYRLANGKPEFATSKLKKVASVNEKAQFVIDEKPDLWQEIVEANS